MPDSYREIMSKLQKALAEHRTRENDCESAKHKIREILKLEMKPDNPLVADYGLALSDDGLGLRLGQPGHVQELLFRGLPSGNMRVLYRSPYLPIGADGMPGEVAMGTEYAASFSDHNVLSRYLQAFWKRVTVELESYRDEWKDLDSK